MEQLSNNLANSSSVGYKQDKSVDAGIVPLTVTMEPDVFVATGESPAGMLLYSAPAAQYVDLSPGPVRATGNPFDLSLEGNGFFTVMTEAGPRLTRAGNFRIDAAGDLVTAAGNKVLGTGGPIRVGAGLVAVGEDGQVTVDGAPVDTLKIQKVSNPSLLRKEGGVLFEAPPEAGLGPGGTETRVRQGSLEESNVSAVQGMTEMVEASRMFEAYAKMMSQISELNSKATGELGRV
jgi:flagellar basal-body rod protein FlgG